MGRRCAVIDIETRSSVDTMPIAEPRPEGGYGNAALQRVAAAVVLTFRESGAA